MSTKEILHLIEVEIDLIKESQKRISAYKRELTDFSPFKFGDHLIGNDRFANNEKPFVVDTLSVSHSQSSVFVARPFLIPKYFIASGLIIKKDETLGLRRVQRSVKIEIKGVTYAS